MVSWCLLGGLLEFDFVGVVDCRELLLGWFKFVFLIERCGWDSCWMVPMGFRFQVA